VSYLCSTYKTNKMKLKDTHFINDLLGTIDGKIIFNDYEKLILTDKTLDNAGNIKLNYYKDDYFNHDLCVKTIDSILSNLKSRKLLLIHPKVEGMVFEYDYNGRYCKFKIHRGVEDEISTYEIGFIRSDMGFEKSGFTSEKYVVSKELGLRMDMSIKDINYNNMREFYFFNVIEYFFRQIIFIELSLDRVKVKEILPKSKNGDILKGNVLKNETEYKFTQVDSLWNVKSINVGEFKVRGHFRLQPCGVGYSQVKLIFIDEFLKTKYIRKTTREMTFKD